MALPGNDPHPTATRRRRPRTRWAWLVVPLVLVVVAGCSVAVGGGLLLFRVWAPVSTVGTLDFANPLRVPPLAASTVDPDGTRVFALELQAGSTSFRPGPATATWGYDGSYLSPTLRAERGERVRVDVTNGVDQPTTMHWHGMHLPPSQDGGPHQPIEPGATRSPAWTVDQPAATLWFHPHPHEATGEQVQRGAAGMFLVDDPAATDRLGLPTTYGVDDMPVIVQDRTFDDDNQFGSREPLFGQMGPLGDQLLVNGTWNPHLDVGTERVRLRLLNASNARLYNFTFSDHRRFALVGTDGGLLEGPVTLDAVQLSPGERAEVVVDVAPNDRVVLRSEHVDLHGTSGDDGRFAGILDAFDVLELRAASALQPSAPLAPALATIDRPTAVPSGTTRTFRLDNNRINGQQMAMERVDEVVQAGSTEVWAITNEHNLPHSFHPHLTSFLVLDVDGTAPPRELSGWKDTVYVPPGSTIRVAIRFEDWGEPTSPSMFHCHILRHEDSGMMGQFVVVPPGESALAEVGHDGHAGG